MSKEMVCDFCGREIEKFSQKGILVWENAGGDDDGLKQDVCYYCYVVLRRRGNKK